MVWVIDKKVVRYLLQSESALAEIPIRVKIEFQLEDGQFVPDTLKLETLYNKKLVCKRFPGVDGEWLDGEIEKTVDQAIDEHLRMEGYMGTLPSQVDDSESGGDAAD